MQDWYIPITILPGICLLILSTSNIMIDLGNELKSLIRDSKEESELIERKLKQLKFINRAMVLLYLSVGSIIVSALLSGLSVESGVSSKLNIYVLFLGVAFAFVALLTLVTYSFRAVKLRQDQYHDKC